MHFHDGFTTYLDVWRPHGVHLPVVPLNRIQAGTAGPQQYTVRIVPDQRYESDGIALALLTRMVVLSVSTTRFNRWRVRALQSRIQETGKPITRCRCSLHTFAFQFHNMHSSSLARAALTTPVRSKQASSRFQPY
jgi:hypothetical protein